MPTKRLVALLPMKAHSARVPRKNFRPLADKPLFRWVLDRLLAVEAIDLVVINTDARGILAEHGLENSPRILVRDRKPELCGDLVSMNRVLADDVANVQAGLYLMTHTTNPFLRSETIRNAVSRLRDDMEHNAADSLFSVSRVQTRFYRADGSAVNHDPSDLIRTQDLEPWFEENSCLYLFTADSFAKTQARIGAKPILFEMPALEALDIDTPEDWHHAELLARAGFPTALAR